MNKTRKFLRKYWLCFLLSVLMVVGMLLSTVYKDVYESGSEMIRFNLQDVYLIFGIPLVSFIYGCLSYLNTKKTWIPQLIIYSITCIYFFATNFIMYKELNAGVLWFSLFPVIFSLLGTGITAFIYYVVKSIREERE